MKRNLPRILAILLLAGPAYAPLHAGGNVLLYPFARLFGSLPESELVKCREAFAEFKATLGTRPIRVAPVLWVDGPKHIWKRPVADALVREMRPHTTAPVREAPGKPDVPPAEFRRNQLRYLWERGAQYAAWRRAAPPSDDYLLCAEVWGHGGKVGAIQVYVLDGKGQIAYCRLFNSHHFGPNLPLQPDEPLRLIAEKLFEDLQKKPEQVFPPYGVG
ncbi:MAG: hypothetical protein JSR48_13090 [Verrucomicrobia bacterium]|nr:hypothetical protein [Verrucomicrobiota bacterium]